MSTFDDFRRLSSTFVDFRQLSSTLSTFINLLNCRESLLSLIEFTNTGLRGLVVDLKGNPVSGATVGVMKGGGSEWAGKNVTSTERGEFWKLLEPGTYTVQAWVNSCMFSGSVQVKVEKLTIKNIVVRKKLNCL